MKPRILALASLAALLCACAPAHHSADRSRPHGFDAMGHGIEQLVLSPFMIVSGLLEGIVMLPYYMATDLHALNHAMLQQDAAVDLERTYAYAYGSSLPHDTDRRPERVFKRMADATLHFQQVLKGYGVEAHRDYILTAVLSPEPKTHALYAVVYRPTDVINVRQNGIAVALNSSDARFFRPYARDAKGRPLDTVVDWAAVPRAAVGTQKGQAILMTLAANSVLVDRRSREYWLAQQRWRAGHHFEVVAESQRALQGRLGAKAPLRG